jgi:porphobilinogen synthase
MAAFPQYRARRLRGNPLLRKMVRETRVTADDLIYPLFVTHAETAPIPSMPGINRFSVDDLCREVERVAALGIPGIILFGIPEEKDEQGSGAYAEDGIVPRAFRALKKAVGDAVLLVADVCMCEYTSHGHCGILRAKGGSSRDASDEESKNLVKRLEAKGFTVEEIRQVQYDYDVSNDATLDLLARAARVYAEAGADVLAPSDMMDGRVAAIRQELDNAGFTDRPIMAYAAKYSSGFYGPFREAADSAPQFGDRRSYQMDPANRREALKEVALDVEEGADIVMVKPALPYLDIIRDVRESFELPVAAYNVSGEYSMVKAAAANGWIDEDRVIAETLTSIKRAGADIILTYHAKECVERRLCEA